MRDLVKVTAYCKNRCFLCHEWPELAGEFALLHDNSFIYCAKCIKQLSETLEGE